jgi:hypothetical protein
MQNSSLIEGLKLLQQRRQQQQELIQQHLANTSSSLLINRLTSLGGVGVSGGATTVGSANAMPVTGNASVESLLLRELQQKLLAARGGSGASGLFHNVHTAAPASVDMSWLLGGANSAAAVAPGSSLSANPSTMSNEDLLRVVAASGLINNSSASTASFLVSQLQARSAAPAGTLASLLGSLAVDGGTRNRKRDQEASFDGGAVARILQRELEAQESKRRRVHTNDKTVHTDANLQVLTQLAFEAPAVHVLASAAAEMERKPAAAPVHVTLSPQGNSFPMPPKKTPKEGMTKTNRLPRLTSFQHAWDHIKSKKMRKEIFLRRLLAGKLPLSTKGLASKPSGGAST